MRSMRTLGLCLVSICVMSVGVAGVAASSAMAEAPELGRCVPAAKEIVSGKKHWKGVYKNAACTVLSPTNEGHWEWVPGPGPNPEFVGSGLPEETMTLETAAGRKIVCSQGGASEGELTGAKSQKLKLTLIGCEDPVAKVKCQNFTPEPGEPAPTPGKIQTQPLVGELGFINKAKKRVGWDNKPETGSIVVEFECGETQGLGTQYIVEGSYITRLYPVNKSIEEFIQFYEAKGGKQIPQSLEGGPVDTLKVKIVEGASEKTEPIGLIEIESFSTFDTIVFNTVV
jgi:hypothetical protein